MAFCKNCGARLEENGKFCPSCGTEQAAQASATPADPAVELPAQVLPADPAPEKASGNLNIGQLVWSIINLLACCTPLGIVALVFTIMATNAPTAQEEAKKLKTAKTCNLIATIGGVVVVVLYIVLVFALTAIGVAGAV